MKLLRFFSKSGAVSVGAVRGSEVVDLAPVLGDAPCMKRLVSQWGSLESAIQSHLKNAPATASLDAVSIKAPLPNPTKIVCIGLNYADHAAETGAAIPTEPVVFSKFPTAIIGPEDSIEVPSISQQVDYEAELVVVIGKQAKRIKPEQAMSHVFGYTCGNDVSARDWQKGRPGGQWLLGKTFDTFAPIGPTLVTADEIKNPHDLNVRLRLNDQTLQDSNTKQFIFQIDFLIAHLSQIFTLEPGDLLFTGTPPGVGVARKPPVFLKNGDRVEVEIGGLGVLANPVVSAPQT